MAILLIGIAVADEINISTYYPAPYGRYREFSTTGKTLLATDEFGNEGPNAKVGIGTTEPNVELDVAGLIRPATYDAINPPPAASNQNEGALYYDKDAKAMYYSDGSNWQAIGRSVGFGDAVDVTATAATETTQGPVTTSGILVLCSSGGTSGIHVYTGKTAGTLFKVTHENSHGAVSLSVPVANGHFWRAEIGSSSFDKVYWIPLL